MTENLLDRWPLPWRVEDYDARIVIVAANGAKVSEIMPGQHAGLATASREIVRDLALFVAEMCNCGGAPLFEVRKDGTVTLAGASGVADCLPWPRACGELEDGA